MCGAYRLLTAHEAVIGFFKDSWQWNADVEPSEKIGPSAKKPGSPSNHRLVVRNDEFVTMRWRFEMKWMRNKGINVPINARSETIFTNGLFKHSARSKRCLIVCDGFYEPKGPKGTKRDQYLFQFDDGRPFALGGLWTTYKGEDDEFDGFTIVTTTPNDQVAPIHGRMPVILDSPEEWDSWMHGSQDDVVHLCQPGERPSLHASLFSKA